MPRAVVIGAGIGGLTAGTALLRKGWEVTVLERAPRLEPVGSGLGVAANALKALDTIGVGDKVRAMSRLQGQAGLRRPDGRWLAHTTEDRARRRYGDSIVVMLRSALVDVLLEALGPRHVRLGSTVTGVDPDRGVVTTEAGDLEADLVVAADGIRSRTRAAVFPEHPGPVYSGVTAWRGLVPRPGGPVRNTATTGKGDEAVTSTEFSSTETWGRGQVFGAHLLAEDTVYFYATDLSPAGATHADERDELRRRFAGWHAPIPALIEASGGHILRDDLYSFDTPLPAMHSGRVALVGDAAHPMTPNLGQGACQAIEDAIVLAHVAGGDLTAYTAARLKRTSAIVARATSICRMTMLRNPVAVAARDTGMLLAGRLMPDLMLRSMDGILGWLPPVPAASGQEPAARA